MRSFDRPARPESDVSPWLARFVHLIPAGGPVLDLACGHGRHARWLRARGWPVTAVDIDLTGVADLVADPQVELLEADLEAGHWPLADRRFAAVLVTNYLHRPHFRWLPDALAPGGVLLVDTFGRGNERLGRPRNPDFLLAPGELLGAFADRLQVVAYEYGAVDSPRPAVRQRLCAVRSAEPVPLGPAGAVG